MGNPYAPKPPGTPPPSGDQQGDQQRQPAGPTPDGWGDRTPEQQPRGRRGAGARAPREPVDPEVVRHLSRRLMVFALILLACLLLSSAPLPWRMGSVALAVAALVAGGLALRRAWRAKVRGMVVVAVAAGMAVSATLGLATLAVIPVWDVEMERQTCMSEAITHSARAQCLTDYREGLEEYQDSLTG
ncbi:hypothetical protein [Sanguibacter sp. 25GB23B1]|uniref:hypothetical protein n=1 Tax=unclassified Sanguibacter TaxID=2645534 RepID=UPI0032AF4BA9